MNFVYKNEIVSKEDLEEEFVRFPEEIRWGEYCNSPEEYIYQGIETGNITKIETNDLFVSEKILSPSEYGKTINVSISDEITLKEFDELVSSGEYGRWNYPLSEIDHLKENGIRAYVVKFKDGECRLAEV